MKQFIQFFGLSVIAAMWSMGTCASTIRFAPVTETHSSSIRLGAISDLSVLPPGIRLHAADLVLASLKPHQTEMILSTQAIAALMRRQMPVLTQWTNLANDQLIVVRRKKQNQLEISPNKQDSLRNSLSCGQVMKEIEKGAVLVVGDLQQSECTPDAGVGSLSYDSNVRAVRASRRLQPGDRVYAVPQFMLAKIRKGERVNVVTQVGPVEVSREVVAFQDARAGGKLFVMGNDHDPFVASLPLSK